MSPSKERISFIPKERGSLPRVLLLDCDDKMFQIVQKAGFQVFQGKSGFVDGERMFPRDSSEIEIVFWDVSKMKPEYVNWPDRNIKKAEDDKLRIAGKTLQNFFSQVRKKDGFVGVFLGEDIPNVRIIADSIDLVDDYADCAFTLGTRYAHSVELSEPQEGLDLFQLFFKRFVREEDLKFYINWHTNLVNTDFYFIDEDNKHYAVVFSDEILISPKIDNLEKAMLYLLEEVLPNICGENIYPDLHRYKWLEEDFFKPPEVKKLEKEITTLKEEYRIKIQDKEQKLQDRKKETSYLYEILYKDDGNSFPEGEKLKDVVKIVLEEDIGFQDVIDMDKQRLAEGLALKEDLRIGDKVFIEVKGTEGGAKANWEKDLMHHVSQYCIATGANLLQLKKILLFNHERRKDPRGRTKPFANDPELLKSCEKNNTALIPIFELFRMTVDLKNNKISQEEAQKRILNSKGLFAYK